MSSQIPQVGQFSPDGQFQWDGREWMPVARGHREPTPWTRPMQVVTAAFLALGVLNTLVANVLYLRAETIVRIATAQGPSVPEDTIRQIANAEVAGIWAEVVAVSVVLLLAAVGSILGWRWVFWVNLAWLILSTIGVFTNLAALAASPVTQLYPRGAIGLNIVLSLAGAALLIWYVVALARYGPWAMRKPGP